MTNRSYSILMKPTLLLTLLMLAIVPTSHGLQPPLAGGFSQAATTDADVLKAAQFAVKAQDAKLSLQYVTSAEQQVVAGINFKLKLTTADGRKADAVVWRKLDGSYELTSWQSIAADPAILTTEYIYDTGPYPQIHATTIVETPTGLVTAWFGGTAERNPDVCIWVSRQLPDGQWTEGVETANGVQADGKRHPTWNPVLFQPKDAPLMLFYKVGPSPSTWWGELKTSIDGGKTWSAAQKLPQGIFGPIKNKPVQLANGDILCPTSNETDMKPSAWAIYFERTADLGKTWTRTELLHDGLKISAIQPSLLFLGGGKLQAVGRTRQGKVFQITSEDAGKTWDEISLTELPNPNSGTDAITLADGRHLLIYNHTAKGRSPLNLAVSKDGKTWEAALVFEDEPKKEFSYPAIIQTQDGLVHITYTWKRAKVKHLVIDPTKLSTKSIVNGQ
jgi:predicted neuraminidase